jgi:hypothetical protein
MNWIIALSGFTNVAVVIVLLRTRRSLQRCRRLFRISAGTNRQTFVPRHRTPWETR